MKFKIKKSSFDLLEKNFKNIDFVEIELEPVIDTATQFIYESELRNKAFKMGIERGYREGFYEGRCPEKKHKCFCDY